MSRIFRYTLFVACITALMFFGLAGSAFAVEIRTSDSVYIGPHEVIDDDLVISGQKVVVDGSVNGDLIVTGQEVTINGNVGGSLVIMGQTLTVNGSVNGTVYSAGTALTLGPNAIIRRNVAFAGYSYRADSGSIVNRDNLIAGYQAMLAGETGRNLIAALGALELNGRIGGNVNATVEQPGSSEAPFPLIFFGQNLPALIPSGIRVAPEAFIGGTLSYTSPVDQMSTIRAQPEGGVVFSALIPAPTQTAPVVAAPMPGNPVLMWFLARLREIVTLMLFGGILFWLMPSLFTRVSEHAQTEALPAGAFGILVMLLGYAAVLMSIFLLIALVAGLGMLTMSGLALSVFGVGFSAVGLIYSLFSILIVYVSKLVVVYPLTHLLLERTLPAWNRYRIVPLFLGVIVFVFLRSIPWLGFVIAFVVTIIGLGAMWLTYRGRVSISPAPKLAMTPA